MSGTLNLKFLFEKSVFRLISQCLRPKGVWWLCLQSDGLEQVEGSLLVSVGRGDFCESVRLGSEGRTATSVADDACEIVQQSAEGMDDGIVIEPLGMHLL